MKVVLTALLLAMFTVVGVTDSAYALPDANLGSTSPRNANSNPDGAHVHFLRNGEASDGIQDEVRLKAYYPADVSSWNSLYFEFSPGANLSDTHVCNTEADGGTQLNRFVHVELTTNAGSRTFYIQRSRVCVEKSGENSNGVNSSNAFYARYGLPPKPSLSTVTDKYEVDILIKYDDSVPNGDNGVRFRATGPDGNPKIGPTGGGGRSFPVLGDWSLHANESLSTTIVVPFGASCDGGDVNNPKIRLYDADNGPGGFTHDVVFRVKNIDTGNYERFNDWGSVRGGNGTAFDGNTTYRPPNGAANAVGESWVKIDKMVVGERYQVEIRGLNPRNTIDIGVPGDTIFGDISCGSAKLIPKAGADAEVEVGTPFTFENWVETNRTENTGTDTFRIKVNDVGAQSVGGSSVYGPFDRQLNPDREVPDGRRYYSFTPTIAGTYCLETKISNYPSYAKTPRGDTARQCVTASPPPAPGTERVDIKPVVELFGGDDVEADQNTLFRTYAEISNYPNFNDDEWGYSGTATKANANNMRQNPTYNGTRSGERTASGSTTSDCVRSENIVDSRGRITGTRCVERGPEYCVNGSSMPNCPYQEYKYSCQSYDSGWTTATSFTCTDHYICHTQYDTYTQSPAACNYWKCQYGASAAKNADIFGEPYGPNGWPSSNGAEPFYDTGNPGSSKCQARCNGGTGDVAGQAAAGGSVPDGSAWDSGDLNCYERPSFTLRCTSRALPTNPAFPDVIANETAVNREGRTCQRDVNHRGTNIGQTVCMRMTPSGAAWNVLDPVNGTGTPWSFRYVPLSDEKCKKVVGKPYVRVVGGDTAAGVGAGLTANSSDCTSPEASGIVAYNKGMDSGYSGSGTSITALARGTISGFGSGQFANTFLGAAPKALSFANTSGVWGGNWGGAPACVDVSRFAESNTTSGDVIVSNTVVLGEQKRKVNGDVYISGNIIYATNPGGTWTSLESIPLYQLLVVGDIYIGSNVSQLDGTYIALSSGSSGGNIYTCANGLSAPAAGTWTTGCARQLAVNGSLIADKVHLLRDCSTVNRSSSLETTVFSGGADAQQCNTTGLTKAAEVINYLPDQWIRSSVGVPGTTFDAITNMPPIL